MLSFETFFSHCAGTWVTERTYHTITEDDVERSHTTFQVTPLTSVDKQKMISGLSAADSPEHGIAYSPKLLASIATVTHDTEGLPCPGFSIQFDTTSERGETVDMALNALFIPDTYFSSPSEPTIALPPAAKTVPSGDLIQGIYLRDRGYFDTAAIAGWFTYQPARQTLEMTTHYSRSVAVDQMRFITPTLRLRTIVTYQRPEGDQPPSVIDLVGFGVEHKSSEKPLDPSDAASWSQNRGQP
ncbi:MAG: phycobiliprotein lyase [Cyanobacteria bacterium P01_A01_bin.135]